MQALRRALFEDPLTIYVALGMIEIVLLAVWHRSMTPRRLLVLAAPLLLGGGVFWIERLVVTDGEVIVAALEEIAEGVSADPPDLGPARTYLGDDAAVDLALGPDTMGMSKTRAIAQMRSLIRRYGVTSVAVLDTHVRVTGNSARVTFSTNVTYRTGRKTTRQTYALTWTVDWKRRQEGWRIIGVDRSGQGLGL